MNAARNEAGFSLTELLIAMLVTMIVSGAVFTLLNAGQGAFRREPELTDRQQNIRLAMDLIQRDIATGGAGMDPFEQAFSAGDGPLEAAPLLNGLGPGVGPVSTAPWDVLEVKGADTSCNDLPTTTAALPANMAVAAFNITPCFPRQGLLAISFNAPVGGDTAYWGMSGVNAGATINFVQGQQPAKSDITRLGYPTGAVATKVIPIQMARYQILADAAGVPNLWRSGRGGLSFAGARLPVGDPNGDWQLVARGIEDLQVRYRGLPNAWLPSPPVAAPGAVNNVVKEVEVTLWARTLAPTLQGQTTRSGVTGIRGSLVTVTTPRAALMALNGAVPPAWH